MFIAMCISSLIQYTKVKVYVHTFKRTHPLRDPRFILSFDWNIKQTLEMDKYDFMNKACLTWSKDSSVRGLFSHCWARRIALEKKTTK